MAITQANIATWLGRPLTPTEITNFDSYLSTASAYLEGLLCIDVTAVSEGPEARVYESRDGYSTVFTDYFSGEPTVTINGTARTDFSSRFFDNRNSTLKNSLVFECKFNCNDEVTVTAKWGFETLPNDLGSLLAQLFAISAKPYKASGDLKSKKVEDFSITFGDRSDVEMVVSGNALTIQKYSLCSVGNIRSGKVCRIWI